MEPTMIGAYAGMFMVLAAFATETRGLVSSRSITYLVLMAIGEALLTVRAYVTGEWPFAVLGGIWAVFAIYSILKPPEEDL
jgi:predicted ATP-grasp superfamily ATP-dependent carboligase